MKIPHHIREPVTIFILAAFILLATGTGYAKSEYLTLSAEDGYQIAATLSQPDKNPAVTSGVVLLHMYRQSMESWQPLTDTLVARGITTLAIDLRGHGQSLIAPDGSDDSKKVIERDSGFFNTMYLDAEAGLRYLRDKLLIKQNRTALIGASVGCSVAIHTAIKNSVAAVVVMTPGKNYLDIPTIDHIKNWKTTPLFILTSAEEADRGAETIYTVLQHKGAELKVFEEEDIHGTNMFGEVDNVENLIADWLTVILSK
jgi:pimeloyl-ACP methyl ester carboxylesterase